MEQPSDRPVDPTTDERPPGPPSRSGRPTARHVLVSAAVATVAAILAAVVITAIGGDDEPAADGTTVATLIAARPAPTTAFPRLGGGEASLADYEGRPVVLNFFAESCVPCRREMPDLERIHDEVGDRVAVVGVDQGDTAEVAAAFVEEVGITYDVGLDPSGDLARELGVDALPGTIFITAAGEIDGVHRGRLAYDDLRRLVDEHFL